MEVYRDDQAPARHKETAHYAKWRNTVADMMAEARWQLGSLTVDAPLADMMNFYEQKPKPHLLMHYTSGDIVGDYSSSVSYVSMVFMLTY